MDNPFQDPLRFERHVPECVMVIFGANGDLTKRKLVPALYALAAEGSLPEGFTVIGAGRSDLTDDEFRADMREGVERYGRVHLREEVWDSFAAGLRFVTYEMNAADGFNKLRAALETADRERGTAGNRVLYFSTPPNAVMPLADRLNAAGLTAQAPGTFVRVIIEKPFGRDLATTRQLNERLHSAFVEEQIYRIDHYLGKETVQNLLVFRFANGIFEPIWNRNFIDHVQITAAETLGIERRGPFYEKAGALRDVVQNHMMELMSFVAMEPPSSFASEAVRREKVKVWQAIPPLPVENAVRGQYGSGLVDGEQVAGYREEPKVNPESGTETYAAVRLEIENWRWAGVPFYLRAGKRLKKQATEISIQFKQPPLMLFNRMADCAPYEEIQPNLLTIRIQPDEGISLRFGAKVPTTPGMAICPVHMDFDYAAAFGKSSANGYERLLVEAMLGEQTLFSHRDGVETNWALYTPILEAWANKTPEIFPNYAAGSWGPECSDKLLERYGHQWRNDLGRKA
jgi:glucose-6-phosphate 1-dehydrogenase